MFMSFTLFAEGHAPSVSYKVHLSRISTLRPIGVIDICLPFSDRCRQQWKVPQKLTIVMTGSVYCRTEVLTSMKSGSVCCQTEVPEVMECATVSDKNKEGMVYCHTDSKLYNRRIKMQNWY